MTIDMKRSIVGAGVVLACFVWAGTAQAANITATETAQELGVLTGSQFDVAAFVATASALEFAEGSGAFLANSTATGSALVVLTEAGGGNSDWLELVYSGPGGFGTETIAAHWRSDADPGGLPALPIGVTPMFLQETGGVQDITALLAASATASGFAFPSNLTVQVQSDIDAVPEPASMLLLGTGIIGVGARRWRNRRSRG